MIFKKLHSEKGMTLMEVILAIVILGIVVVPLFTAFSSSFINIVSMGRKNAATAVASDMMEEFYALQPLDEQKIEQVENDFKQTSVFDFAIAREESFQAFADGSQVAGFKITIEVFYFPEDRQVSLTSFFPEREVMEDA